MNKLHNIMKKITIATLFCLFCALSCQVNELEVSDSSNSASIQVHMSATMPEFKDGGDPETKSSLESVVRVRWNAGDELSVINLTTGKQLGGCIRADASGASTTFSPDNLTGTIHVGDRLVFLLDNDPGHRSASEKNFESFTMDFSSQRGDAENVPIVVYANHTATQEGTIDAVNPAFNFLMGYVQLGISALPASTSVTELGIDNLNTSCQFSIVENEFVTTPQNGNLILTQAFNANSKGANTRYFSCFTSPSQGSARNAHITANAESHITAWLKAALSAGFYYQSVATGFTNENVQFVDDAFKSYCVSHYDLNNDGEVSFAEAAAVTSYSSFTNAEKASIKSVYELAYFPKEIGIPSFEGCTALENIILPGTLTEIPENEFKGCTSLGEINIPDNVTTIGKNAFEGCTSLQYFSGNMASTDHVFLIKEGHILAFAPYGHNSVFIPNAVSYIDEGVFENCNNVGSIQFSNIGHIGKNAFKGCGGLLSVNLPGTVTEIQDGAFKNCSALAKVYCQGSSPAAIGDGVFEGCNAELKIFVSELSLAAYTATDWNDYSLFARDWHKVYYTTTDGNPITPNPGWETASSENGSNDLTILSNTYTALEGGVMIFSGDIREIKHGWFEEAPLGRGYYSMFAGQTTLTSIKFPDGLHQLPSLRGCTNLETITIPESLDYEGFASEAIEKDGLPNLSHFEGRNISSDGLFIIVDGKLKSAVTVLPNDVTIPSDVDIIDGYAFRFCQGVKTIRLNERVSEIGLHAFRDLGVLAYYFSSLVPPTLSGDDATFLDGFGDGGKIYVPSTAVDDYKSAGANWAPYVERIVGY